MRRDNRDDETSKLPDQVFQISESCSQMVLQFRDQIEVIEVLIELMITCILLCFVFEIKCYASMLRIDADSF